MKNHSPANSRATTYSAIPTRYCAIYTRKSSEEGLEQSFNSLDAQREACEAYVLSQKAEGWVALPQMYNDGGFSGGNIERPGLKQLMCDIEAKKVQTVVVYKVDRLTRSLADFAKLVELFDAYGVSFVSITQQFNTTSSMGRLTLNVLLSFAQFEREVTGERIRDKIAASKAKGMWMGGMPAVGYCVQDKTLIIDIDSAQLVRDIYKLYLEMGNVRLLKAELDKRGWLTPERISRGLGQSGGLPFYRGHLYRILSNPVYIGKVVHKDNSYDGQHAAIIDDALWNEVQAKLKSNSIGHRSRVSCKAPGLLAGLLFDEAGERFSSVQSNKATLKPDEEKTTGKKQNNADADANYKAEKHHRRYHYYISQRLIREGKSQAADGLRIPAQELEQVIIKRLHHFLTQSTELFKLVDGHGLTDTYAIDAVLKTAVKLAEVLNAENFVTLPADLIVTLQSLTERIIIRAHEVEITIKFDKLIAEAKGKSHAPASVWEYFDWGNLRYTITLPVTLKRSGLNVRLTVQAQEYEIKRNADVRMVKLLSRADHYFNLLTAGKVSSFKEIGILEKLSSSHVSRVTLLAFLSPEIVKGILEGRHPPSLTSDSLMKSLPLPTDWAEQKQVLGFH